MESVQLLSSMGLLIRPDPSKGVLRPCVFPLLIIITMEADITIGIVLDNILTAGALPFYE